MKPCPVCGARGECGHVVLELPPEPPDKRQLPLYPNYDGTPPHVKDSDTSMAAAESIRGIVGPMHAEILRQLRLEGELNDDDLEEILEQRHQTISARRRELVLMGRVVDSGRRRATRSGRMATLWKISTEEGNDG